MAARKQLHSKQFDIDLNWMGRFKQYQLSKFWRTNNWKKRLQMIREARGGGSVAPDILQEVRAFATENPDRLELCENLEVECISSTPSCTEPSRDVWTVKFLNSDRVGEFDYIWLATGRKRGATRSLHFFCGTWNDENYKLSSHLESVSTDTGSMLTHEHLIQRSFFSQFLLHLAVPFSPSILCRCMC